MNTHKKNARAFTTLELLIAVALSSIIVLGIFIIFRIGTEQTNLGQARMTLQDSVRNGMNKMLQEIRATAPSKISISEDMASIQLQVPNPNEFVNADYSVKWSEAHIIQYALGETNSRQIIRTDSTSGRTSVIANNIVGLQFTSDTIPPKIITITIQAQKTLPSGRAIPATPLKLVAQAKVRNS